MDYFIKEPQLQGLLDQLFEDMKQLLPEGVTNRKEDILTAVIKNMKDEKCELNLDDIKNQNVQKTLMGAILSQALGLKDQSIEQIKSLNPANKEMTLDPKNEEKLTAKLDKALTLKLSFLTAAKEMQETIENKLTPKPDMQQQKKKDNDEAKDEKNDEKKEGELLALLYGGTNPLVEGAQRVTVLSGVFESVGFTHQTAADPKSLAVMVEEISYHPNVIDPLGKESMKLFDELAEGINNTATRAATNQFKPTP